MISVATGKPILDLEVSFLIFKGNYQQLLGSSQPSAQAVAGEWDTNPKLVERRALTIARDFHNFFASLSMLVDHYRTNKNRKVYCPELAAAHSEEIENLFHKDVLSKICGKLRNLYSHAEIPVIRLRQDFPNYRALLDIGYLRAGGLDTNCAEAEYLSALPDLLDLHEVVTPYFMKAEKLYFWTQRKYAELNPKSAGDLALLLEPLANNSSRTTPPRDAA